MIGVPELLQSDRRLSPTQHLYSGPTTTLTLVNLYRTRGLSSSEEKIVQVQSLAIPLCVYERFGNSSRKKRTPTRFFCPSPATPATSLLVFFASCYSSRGTFFFPSAHDQLSQTTRQTDSQFRTISENGKQRASPCRFCVIGCRHQSLCANVFCADRFWPFVIGSKKTRLLTQFSPASLPFQLAPPPGFFSPLCPTSPKLGFFSTFFASSWIPQRCDLHPQES